MGQVVTFYSYKGGVGRSMALANVAALLSRWGYKTLVVDWDLEAPGLENYFKPHTRGRDVRLKGGVVELLDEANRRPKDEQGQLPWRDYLVRLRLPGGRAELRLLGAGVVDEDYFGKLRGFDVDDFYLERRGGYVVEALRDEWRREYDFVLIDSRTGVTDLGGICTIQLPDILVLLFTSNEQNVTGTAEAGRSAVQGRRTLPFDRVRLLTLPVASRFDTDTEFDLSEDWLRRAAGELADLYADWLPPEVKPVEALKLTLLPYRAYYSFGEQLAVVREETVTNYSLAYAYETLAAVLVQNLGRVERLKANRDSYVKLATRPDPAYQLQPAAFLSYAQDDDKYGHVSKFRERLQDEVQLMVGSEFPIFQDRTDIQAGEDWRRRLEESIDEVTFLVPIITPRFFNSRYCREELRRFLEREKKLKRDDLVLPVYFIDTPLLNDEALRAGDELAQAVASRPYVDWRELRYEPLTNPLIGRTLERLAVRIRDSLPRARPQSRRLPITAPPTDSRHPEAPAEETGTGAADRSPRYEPPTCVVDPLHRRDFTSISEAISRSTPGTKILVRPGLYSETLVIDKPLEIIGDGEPGEIVVQATGGDIILFRTSMGRVANLTLRRAAGGKGSAVNIAQGRLELEDCDISSRSLSCVVIHSGADPRLRRNRIHDGKGSGVYIYQNGLGTLEDNDIFANDLAGVTLDSGADPRLRRNRIHDGKGSGVYISGGGLGTLEDNDVFGNSLFGVRVTSGGRPTLRRNRITGNGRDAIKVDAGGGGVFEGNDLRNNAGRAWKIDDPASANIFRTDNLEG